MRGATATYMLKGVSSAILYRSILKPTSQHATTFWMATACSCASGYVFLMISANCAAHVG